MRFFLIPLFCSFFFLSFSFAQKDLFFLYQIKKNDSLLVVCDVFRISRQELLKYNSEEVLDRFWQNDTLKIPLTKFRLQDHKIKKGDTLFDLVKYYKTDIELIYALNEEADLNKLMIGKTLRIPVFFRPAKEQTVRANNSVYQVRKGDSYYSIAEKFNLNYEDLQIHNANRLLQPGETISIPQAKINSSKQTPSPTHYKDLSQIPAKHYKVCADTRIKSPESGEIIGIRPLKGYGNAIFIKGKKGVSVFATKGFQNILISYGNEIKKGQPLAVVKKDYYLHYFLIQNGDTLR